MISRIRFNASDIPRSLDQIADKLNELIDAINQTPSYERTPSKEEKMRVITKDDGTVKVEFKSTDGWVESDNTQPTGFKRIENKGEV